MTVPVATPQAIKVPRGFSGGLEVSSLPPQDASLRLSFLCLIYCHFQTVVEKQPSFLKMTVSGQARRHLPPNMAVRVHPWVLVVQERTGSRELSSGFAYRPWRVYLHTDTCTPNSHVCSCFLGLS